LDFVLGPGNSEGDEDHCHQKAEQDD
jgi:hypothetical protein